MVKKTKLPLAILLLSLSLSLSLTPAVHADNKNDTNESVSIESVDSASERTLESTDLQSLFIRNLQEIVDRYDSTIKVTTTNNSERAFVVKISEDSVEIQTTPDLEEVFTPTMLARLNTLSNSLDFSETDEIEQKTERFLIPFNEMLKSSSIGQNTYDYETDKINQAELEGEKQTKESNNVLGKNILIVSSVLVFLGIVASYFLFRKNGIISKHTANKYREEYSKDLTALKQDPTIVTESKLNKYENAFKVLDKQKRFKNSEKIFLDEQMQNILVLMQTLDTTELLSFNVRNSYIASIEKNKPTFYKKNVQDIQKIIEADYKNQSFNTDILKTVEFAKLLERTDFSKESLKTYIVSKNKSYKDYIDSRTILFDKIVQEMFGKATYFNKTEKEKINKELDKIKQEISENYSRQVTMSEKEFKKFYENKIYFVTAKQRLATLNEPENIKEYLQKSMGEKELVFSSPKVLKRTITKAKLLYK